MWCRINTHWCTMFLRNRDLSDFIEILYHRLSLTFPGSLDSNMHIVCGVFTTLQICKCL